MHKIILLTKNLQMDIAGYDNWKLALPDDYYEMVSNCCGARLDESEERCMLCGEGCVAVEDYEYNALKEEEWAEFMSDESRGR